MNQEPQPRKRLGLDITSELFVFEDPERIRTTLNRLFGVFFLGSVSVIVLALIIGWNMAFRLSVISTISFGLIILMHRAGHPREASLLSLVTITAVALAGVVTGDGIHDAAIILLPVIIALGSIVLSRPLFYSLTALILSAILIIGVLEYQGTIDNKYFGMWGPGDIAILMVISLAGAVIMRVLTLGMNESLVRAHTSERDYRDLFNSSSDAIYVHDADTGAILDVNDRTLEIFGFSREELETSEFQCTITGIEPYTFEDALAHMREAVETGPQVFEWLARTKDRGNLWVEVAMHHTQIGGRDRILAVVRDIDDRKHMEEQLRQSEKLQAVGTLAGGVAHDFNNQLTGIIGWADMIRDQIGDDPDLETATSNILISAKRASDLTAQLLAFARKGKFESRPVDLHGLIEEVVQLLKHTIDKRITIRTDLQAEAPYTTGDPSQLQNALLNLGVNARDAMPEGGTLVVTTGNRIISADDSACTHGDLAPGPYVEISVADNGVGMDSQTLKSIFEPFFTTKQASKGTGLGLAAVYGTISNHNGCIKVESSLGNGTTVRVGLPQGERPALVQEIKAVPRQGGSGTILVIDDEDILIQTVSAILQREGYKTVTCTDSSEGLERYRKSPDKFDLVLLDMIMPGMNGPEVFRALQEINPRVAVLIMSGATANHEVQDLADAGARGFLAKPFHPNDLVRTIAEVWPGSATG
jgi:PAS domain S-box-containing protein